MDERVREALSGASLVVELPRYTKNLARER
jgi:hypothetical protein